MTALALGCSQWTSDWQCRPRRGLAFGNQTEQYLSVMGLRPARVVNCLAPKDRERIVLRCETGSWVLPLRSYRSLMAPVLVSRGPVLVADPVARPVATAVAALSGRQLHRASRRRVHGTTTTSIDARLSPLPAATCDTPQSIECIGDALLQEPGIHQISHEGGTS